MYKKRESIVTYQFLWYTINHKKDYPGAQKNTEIAVSRPRNEIKTSK